MKEEHLLNGRIYNSSIRIVKSDALDGVYTRQEALQLAKDNEVDLIQLSVSNETAICRLMDYSKFVFQLKKIEKQQAKNNKACELKEVWLSPVIGDHDLGTKKGQVKKFLNDGHDVKLRVKFQGRMIQHSDLGKLVIYKILDYAQDEVGIRIKSDPAMNGKNMICIISKK